MNDMNRNRKEKVKLAGLLLTGLMRQLGTGVCLCQVR